MSTQAMTKPEMLTRPQWLDLIRNLKPVEPLETPSRRKHARQTALGTARLALICEVQGRPKPVTHACELWQCSPEGLALAGAASVDVGTPVVVELDLGAGPVYVSGEVIHCTESKGVHHMGVQLSF